MISSLGIPEDQLKAEKKYFSEHFAGTTVCGNLWQVGKGRSIERVYEKMDNVGGIIYDVPLAFPFLASFFYNEWENKLFPQEGRILLIRKNVIPGQEKTGEVFCNKPPGDSIWNITTFPKDPPIMKTGSYLFYITQVDNR